MSGITSLAGIPFSQINTRNPLLAKWALTRISDLRRQSEPSADEAIRALFDESTIHTLLTAFADDILIICLFRELPDDLLKPHLSVIAEIWQEFPAWSSYHPVRLLARYCPDRALQIFLEFLNHPPYESERLYAIIEAAGELPEPAMKQLADASIATIFSTGKDTTFGRVHTCLLTAFAWKTENPQVIDLIKIIANVMPEQELDTIDIDQRFLVDILTGTTEPLLIMQEFLEGYDVPKFIDVPLFLPDSALAAQLDDVVPKLGNLDYQAALDFFDQHKQRLSERVVSALDMCRDRWLAIPGLDEHEATASLFALFPACIAASVWNRDPIPPTDNADALLSFLATNLRNVPITDTVVTHFANMERVQAVGCLTEALAAQMDTYGAVRIAEIMGRLCYQEFIQPLIGATDADFDLLCETSATALVGYGQAAVGAIIKTLELTQKELFFLQTILEQIGGEEVLAYFERHFDELAKADKESLASALEALPEHRFIERLAPLTGKGQSELDCAYLILNKLHGIESGELFSLEEEYLAHEAEDAERRAALVINEMGSVTRDELTLEMECSVCGDISRYYVESVYISGTEAKPFIADELNCLGCGAEETLSLTPSGSMAVTVELMRLTAIKDKKTRADAAENSPLTILPRLTAMGREMSINEAIALYKMEIAKNPNKVEHYLGYANILRFIKRYEKAEDCYMEAVRIEPRLIEGWYELSQLEKQFGNYQKAFFALYEGARHLPNIVFHHVKPYERAEFVNAYVTDYNDFKKRISIPGTGLSHSMFGTQIKVGRNDPCTCGSGKKFKKCCGK